MDVNEGTAIISNAAGWGDYLKSLNEDEKISFISAKSHLIPEKSIIRRKKNTSPLKMMFDNNNEADYCTNTEKCT